MDGVKTSRPQRREFSLCTIKIINSVKVDIDNRLRLSQDKINKIFIKILIYFWFYMGNPCIFTFMVFAFIILPSFYVLLRKGW